MILISPYICSHLLTFENLTSFRETACEYHNYSPCHLRVFWDNSIKNAIMMDVFTFMLELMLELILL